MNAYKRLLPFYKENWGFYVIALCCLLLVALCILIPPKIIGLLVDDLVAGTLTQSMLLTYLASLIGVAVLVYVLRFIWRYCLFSTAFRLEQQLKQELHDKIIKLNKDQLKGFDKGDQIARFSNDVNSVVMLAGNAVLNLFDATITGIAVIMVCALTISWQLTLIALLLLPVLFWLIQYIKNNMGHAFYQNQQQFAVLNEVTQKDVSQYFSIKSQGLVDNALNRFNDHAEVYKQKQWSVAIWQQSFEPVTQFLLLCSTLLVLVIGGYWVSTSQLSFGELTAFSLYQGYLVWPVMAYAWLMGMVEQGKIGLTRLGEVLDIEVSDNNQSKTRITVQKYHLDVLIKGQPYLSEIQFRLVNQQTFSVIGKSGSGKSLIIEEVMNAWPFGLVVWQPQDNVLLNGSIKENVLFGQSCDETLLSMALKDACLTKTLLSLPEGVETQVGVGGNLVSGGQRQRIVLARTFYRQLVLNEKAIDTLLVFDEPLTGLDANTANHVIGSLQKYQTNQTCLMVTNDERLLSKSQQVLWMQDGQLKDCKHLDYLKHHETFKQLIKDHGHD